MEDSSFSEDDFFRAIATSGARVLLIGRRAMVAYGAHVLTADYDLWVHPDDIERLNAGLAPLGLAPNRTADEARARRRYVLENDEHVDVVVARAMALAGGRSLAFDDVWQERAILAYGADGITITLPSIDDLIRTKHVRLRDRDVADIGVLECLKEGLHGDTVTSPREPYGEDAVLTPEEFASRVSRVLADEEAAAETLAIIRWFRRRYPTARARLAYARRKYAEWTREGTIGNPRAGSSEPPR